MKIRWTQNLSNEIDFELDQSPNGLVLSPSGLIPNIATNPYSILIERSSKHPMLERWLRTDERIYTPRSLDVWSDLIPAVLGQRVTTREASKQWIRLWSVCGGYISANHLLALSYSRFHSLGIEMNRAKTLKRLAEAHAMIERLNNESVETAYRTLMQIPGIGPWTIAETLSRSHGWSDAVSEGDFHLCHHVVYAMTGKSKGTDREMLELLEPFRPFRHLVVMAILHHAKPPPRTAPGTRTPDIRRF
jgi:3-methyladenine DNA glycosylase/8-oxoguanine DNA glycosylase